MKTAYVGGPITVPDTRPDRNILNTMITCVKNAGYTIYCAEFDTNRGELDHPDITPKKIFEKDYQAVESSNLIVLECSAPSTGNGMEVMLAHERSIPIIVCIRSGVEASRMLRGTPDITVINYVDAKDLKKKLQITLYDQ